MGDLSHMFAYGMGRWLLKPQKPEWPCGCWSVGELFPSGTSQLPDDDHAAAQAGGVVTVFRTSGVDFKVVKVRQTSDRNMVGGSMHDAGLDPAWSSAASKAFLLCLV